MKFRPHTHCLTYKDQFAERQTKGFNDNGYSGDGNWIVGDNGSQSMHRWCSPRPDKQNPWMKAILKKHKVNGCCLSHEVALELFQTRATTEECLDGWYFKKDMLK